MRLILDNAYTKAKKLLEDNRDILESMKDALMEFETIDADQVDDLMHRRKVRPPHQWDDNDSGKDSGKGPGKDSGGSKDSAAKGPIGGPVEDI